MATMATTVASATRGPRIHFPEMTTRFFRQYLFLQIYKNLIIFLVSIQMLFLLFILTF